MMTWALRVVAIWVVVAGAIIYGLASRSSLLGSATPAHPIPTQTWRAPQSVPNEFVFHRADDGHFYVDAVINGAVIRFLVDTGASLVVLSPDDARAAGIRVGDRDFTGRANTANGVARLAPVTLREVELKQIAISDVPAAVLEQPIPVSLLGMSFLSRLQSYEIREDQLVLRW